MRLAAEHSSMPDLRFEAELFNCLKILRKSTNNTYRFFAIKR